MVCFCSVCSVLWYKVLLAGIIGWFGLEKMAAYVVAINGSF